MFRDTCYSALPKGDTSAKGVVTGRRRDVPNRVSNCSPMSFENGEPATWSGMPPPKFPITDIILNIWQSVLIHAAAGGVGIAAIRICKDIGAKVIYGSSGMNHF